MRKRGMGIREIARELGRPYRSVGAKAAREKQPKFLPVRAKWTEAFRKYPNPRDAAAYMGAKLSLAKKWKTWLRAMGIEVAAADGAPVPDPIPVYVLMRPCPDLPGSPRRLEVERQRGKKGLFNHPLDANGEED